MSNILSTRSPYRHHYLHATPRRRNFFRPRAAKASGFKFEFGPMALIVALGIVAVFISSIYLMHFNKASTQGYTLRKLEAGRQELLSVHSMRDINLAQAKSLDGMIQAGKMHGLYKPSQVVYVRGDTALASR